MIDIEAIRRGLVLKRKLPPEMLSRETHNAIALLEEVDRLRAWREKAIAVLPLIPREAGSALALRVSELLRPEPQSEKP